MSLPKLDRLRYLLGERPLPITAASLALVLPRYGRARVLKLQRAAGQALTIPAATGKGGTMRLEVDTAITSNTTTIKTPSGTVFAGTALIAAGTSGSFPTASNTNTITLNGSTLGGLRGSFIELVDVAVGVWQVRAALVGSGVAATPFSNT